MVVPTRELCLQVRDDLALAGAGKGVTVVAAYGGRPIDAQIDAIAADAPVVVGTPAGCWTCCAAARWTCRP